MDAAIVEMDLLRDVASRLAAARHGEAGRIVEQATEALRMSKARLYARLKDLGLYDSGRKRRSDAGKLSVPEDVALKTAALVHLGTRANGKKTYTQKAAIETLYANGLGRLDDATGEIVMPSPTTMARAMRAYNCHPDQLDAGHPALSMRSLHPNHVWQIDMSVATLFYAPGGGIQGIEHLDDREVYKNKPDAIARVQKDLCTRWMVTCHTTDAYFVRYRAGHEDAMSFIEFLIEAMQPRPGEPLHGVMVILVMDPGAAARAEIARNFLKRLGVRVIVHRPKNPRAKGSVEGGHNRWERIFESRLALWSPPDMAALNAKADEVRRAHCANAIHSRHGMTRYDAWMRIREDQLVLAPDPETCRDLVTAREETRVVSDQLLISFAVPRHGSRQYRLAHIPGIAPRQTVAVTFNPFRKPAVDVLIDQPDGSRATYTVDPVPRDEWGFVEVGNVWGEEIRALPKTAAERQLERIYTDAYGVPTRAEVDAARKARKGAFEGELNPFADFEAVPVPTYMPRRGQEHPVTVAARELPPIDVVDAVRRLKAAGDGRPDLYARISNQFPTGEVPHSWVAEQEAALRGGAPLRAAGGE